MLEHAMKWLAIVASLAFVAWLVFSSSDALRICEKTHSRDVCVNTVR